MWSWSLLLHIYITILTVPLHNTPFFTGIYKPLLQVHSSRTTHRLFAERVFFQRSFQVTRRSHTLCRVERSSKELDEATPGQENNFILHLFFP